MIYDSLDNACGYHALHPDLEPAFAFLRHCDPPTLATGRHEIRGEEIYALVSRYETRPVSQCRLEAHRRYIDLQCVLQGDESIGWAPLPECAAQTYDASRDCLFANAQPVFLPLLPGRWALFFPLDAHMPGVASSAPCAVLKVVIKIAMRPDRSTPAINCSS